MAAMTAEHGLPGVPEATPADARAMRVRLVGVDEGGAAAMVIDPATTAARLQREGADRAQLRERPGEPPHRLLLMASGPTPPGSRAGGERREVVIDGWRVELEVESAARAILRDRAIRGRAEIGHSGPTQVRAIIPGVVVSVFVVPGDAVTAGQQLLVVEAMKMQNELRAPRDATVEQIAVGPGATIDVGDVLLVLA
jgi:biotin carboxyl carrier protein